MRAQVFLNARPQNAGALAVNDVHPVSYTHLVVQKVDLDAGEIVLVAARMAQVAVYSDED